MSTKASKKRARKPSLFARWRLLAQDGSRRFSIETKDGKTWDDGVDRHFEGIASPGNDVPASPAAEFDELAVGSAIHIERMGNNAIWIRLGCATFWLKFSGGGVVVTLTDGVVDTKTGRISVGIE